VQNLAENRPHTAVGRSPGSPSQTIKTIEFKNIRRVGLHQSMRSLRRLSSFTSQAISHLLGLRIVNEVQDCKL